MVYNYPNPARCLDKTTFRYYLAEQNLEASLVTINIYDQSYDYVATLEGYDRADDGYWEKDWNLEGVASGVYVYIFKAGQIVRVGKVMVIK